MVLLPVLLGVLSTLDFWTAAIQYAHVAFHWAAAHPVMSAIAVICAIPIIIVCSDIADDLI
jgi:hypothetical protein